MRKYVLILAVISTFLLPASLASASTPLVQFSHATVTASKVKGESAVVLTIKNDSGAPVSILSVTSPSANMGMIYYDANMCQGANLMHWLGNIYVPSHSTTKLGYQFQGAMLSNFKSPLNVGQSVKLKIQWNSFGSLQTSIISASVVAPPKGLHFDMGSMKM